nr:MAG TPA: hypothetical protein [Bacteriophage sp.]
MKNLNRVRSAAEKQCFYPLQISHHIWLLG